MLARAYATACPRETRSAPAWPRVWRDRAATSPACQTSRPILPASDTNSCARLSQSPPVGDHGQYRQSHRRARFAKELVALQPDLILSQHHTHHGRAAATNAHHPHRFRDSLPIRSAAASSRASRDLAATSPVSTFRSRRMAGKWLELLKEIAPRVARVAMLFNPASAPYAEYWLNPFKAAAAVLRSGGDRSTCSRQVRARIRRCRTGTRAE